MEVKECDTVSCGFSLTRKYIDEYSFEYILIDSTSLKISEDFMCISAGDYRDLSPQDLDDILNLIISTQKTIKVNFLLDLYSPFTSTPIESRRFTIDVKRDSHEELKNILDYLLLGKSVEQEYLKHYKNIHSSYIELAMYNIKKTYKRDFSNEHLHP